MAKTKSYNPNALYFSKKLRAKSGSILQYPFTIVEAPMGYGKTTAIREALKNMECAVLWQSVFEAGSSYFWADFCDVLSLLSPELADNLRLIGLPTDLPLIRQAVELIRTTQLTGETVLVIDDYHYVDSPAVDSFFTYLLANMPNTPHGLHIVILSRTASLKADIAEMKLKGSVNYINMDTLKLELTDIREYYALCGVSVPDEELTRLYEYSEGWILALFLQMKSYTDTGSFLVTMDIHKMMRTIVWDKLTDDERKFLLRVSPFDSYTLRQAAYMMGLTGTEKLPDWARILSENNFGNSFIQPADGIGFSFRLHSALLSFVRGVFDALPEDERREILFRAGDWFTKNAKDAQNAESKQTEQAMRIYHRLGAYDRILSLNFLGVEFERMEKTDYADIMLDILENATQEMKLANSMSVVKIIFNLFGAGRYEEFSQWCGKMTALAENGGLPAEPDKARLRGELALLTSFTKYNDIAEMGALMRRAHELLDGRPSLISMNDAWTFGNPSVLFMYHAKAGSLDEELADMDENCSHYFALTQGHGSGGDVLMKAEALFNRGDMPGATVAAHKALYQAENKEQECVSIGGALLLGRIAIFNGNSGLFADVLEGRLHRSKQSPIKSNRMEADLADAYLMQLIDRPEDMAEWIRKGDGGEKRLFAMSIPYAQILFGKYLLQTGKPEHWLGMEGEVLALAGALRCLMAAIYGSILTACAHLALGNPREAAAALKTALDMALPDRLYMPFAENISLLAPILNDNCPAAARGEILALAKKQESGKEAILRKLYPSPSFGLSKQEYEVAQLAAEGFSNRQISARVFLSEDGVKSRLKSIFEKLSITSRKQLGDMLKP